MLTNVRDPMILSPNRMIRHSIPHYSRQNKNFRCCFVLYHNFSKSYQNLIHSTSFLCCFPRKICCCWFPMNWDRYTKDEYMTKMNFAVFDFSIRDYSNRTASSQKSLSCHLLPAVH